MHVGQLCKAPRAFPRTIEACSVGEAVSNVVGYTRNCTYRVGVKDSRGERGETMDRYCDHMWTPCREEHAHTIYFPSREKEIESFLIFFFYQQLLNSFTKRISIKYYIKYYFKLLNIGVLRINSYVPGKNITEILSSTNLIPNISYNHFLLTYSKRIAYP